MADQTASKGALSLQTLPQDPMGAKHLLPRHIQAAYLLVMTQIRRVRIRFEDLRYERRPVIL